MSEQTWNQDSIYIFVSYLKVLAASTSLFPVSITCHALPEKAHTTPCPLALKMVANLKLFTLSLYHRHTMPSRCRETCRPRRSGITAIAQPTVVVQFQGMVILTVPMTRHNRWVTVVENSPLSPIRWIWLSGNKWPKWALRPTMAKWHRLIVELSLAPGLLQWSPYSSLGRLGKKLFSSGVPLR